ncbi:hypothetical protein CRG98_042630, partial [Punica granatum]
TSGPHVLLWGLGVPGLRVRMYCFRDFGSPGFVSAFTPSGTLRMYSFRDLGSPDFASTFTASGTSCPRTSCLHLLFEGLRVPGLRVRLYSFRDPPHVLFQGFRVPGLRVHIYCFRDVVSPDFVSAFTV